MDRQFAACLVPCPRRGGPERSAKCPAVGLYSSPPLLRVIVPRIAVRGAVRCQASRRATMQPVRQQLRGAIASPSYAGESSLALMPPTRHRNLRYLPATRRGTAPRWEEPQIVLPPAGVPSALSPEPGEQGPAGESTPQIRRSDSDSRTDQKGDHRSLSRETSRAFR